MDKRIGRRLLLIIVLALGALMISLPGELPIKFELGGMKVDQTLRRRNIDFELAGVRVRRSLDLRLGLDLVGGSRLVFEADTSGLSAEQREAAMGSLEEVMERRVNLFGISEPNVQREQFEGKERIVVELPGVDDTQRAVEVVGRTAQLQFVELGDDEEGDLVPTNLTGADLKEARVAYDQVTGKPVVSMEFTSEGEEKFAQLTERNIGKPLPIMLDGEVISAPVVQDKIVGGAAQISGDSFTLEGVKELVVQLNAGALPVSVSLVSERTVGATLGKESVERSLRAGVLGLGLVLVFMVVFYGRLGLVADLGLAIFCVLSLALYKLIPVVLTLPGIAGFLLSVGMAVDSNILIFERFREERRKGINIEWALETSFDRAWDSIKDANIATLVTAFVLANPLEWPMLHTSGPVRGFAITLAIGIGLGIFTGVFVSRNLLRFMIGRKGGAKK